MTPEKMDEFGEQCTSVQFSKKDGSLFKCGGWLKEVDIAANSMYHTVDLFVKE
jgi:hypothetical protein